jgi:hypothetical protein
MIFTLLIFLRERSEDAQKARRGQKLSLLQNTLTGFLWIFPLIVAINYISVLKNYNFDLSAKGKFSYSPASKRILKAVNKDVSIYAFYPRPLETSGKEESFALTAVRSDLSIYLDQLKSLNPRFSVEFINADVEKEKMAQFTGTSNGIVLVRALKTGGTGTGNNPYAEERIFVQTSKDFEDLERKLVQAVNSVTLPQRKIYFTTSNGEHFGSLYQKIPDEEIKKFTTGLNFYNTYVSGLSFQEGWPAKIPDDADVVAIIGPTVPFASEARTSILNYIKEKNGKVFITIDANGNEDFSWLLEKGGQTFRKENLVQIQGRREIIATNFSEHPISELMTAKDKGVVFPVSGFFESAKGYNGEILFDFKKLLDTGYNTYLDKNKNDKIDKDENQDNYTVSIALELKQKPQEDGVIPGRVVIHAGTSWITDRYFLYNLNPIFSINSLNWLTQTTLLERIPLKKEDAEMVTLKSEQKIFIWVVGLFVYPGIIIAGLSILVIRLRRKKSK